MVKNIIKVGSGVVLGAGISLALTFTGTQDLKEIKRTATDFRVEAEKSIEKIKALQTTVADKEAVNKELESIIAGLEDALEEADKSNNVNLGQAKKEINKANTEIEKANNEVKETKEEVQEILDTSIFDGVK